MSKLYFCVVEDYGGRISVSSFGGQSRAEEWNFAKSCNRKVHRITTDHDEAQRLAARLRSLRANAPGLVPDGVPAGQGSLS